VGARFWLGFMAILFAIALGVIIGLAIFGAALETWGLIGGILALCAVLIGVGWVVDRRRPPRPGRI
jgi:hypothetical protein